MKIKSIFKRSLAVVLALMMLLTSGIVSAVAANVDLAPTGVNHSGGYVYFVKPSSWTSSTIMFCIGHDSYTSCWTMTKLSGNLYYLNLTNAVGNGWNNANYHAVMANSGTWGSGNWGYSNISSNAANYTAKYSNYGFNKGSTYRLTATNSAKNATLTTDYVSGYSVLNSSQTVYSYAADAGSSSYSANAAAGTITLNSYALTGNGSGSSATVTKTTSATSTNRNAANGTTVTLTATPSAGYNFVGWFTSTTATTASSTNTTFTYTCSGSATTYYARFQKAGYSYTVTAGEGGTITSATSGTAASATVTAEPSTGYEFAGWETTNGSVANANSATTTFTPTANGANANATFTKITSTVGVSVAPSAGGSAYITYNGANVGTSADVEYGDSVTITASANAGYKFTGWTVNNNAHSESTNVLTLSNITADTDVVANFEETVTYTVTMSASPAAGGTVTDLGGNTTANVPEGSAINLIATPAKGYHFVNWTITGDYTGQNVSLTSQNISIIPQANVTATANFAPNSGTVTFQAGANGSVTGNGGTATYPNALSATANPATGYDFLEWELETTGELGTDYEIASGGVNESSIGIKILTQGTVVTATASFKIQTFTVRFFKMAGAPLAQVVVEYGSAATAPEAPEEVGYTFSHWDTDFSNVTSDLAVYPVYTANTYTVTVTSPVTGGTATPSTTVTYPDTVTLTATPSSADYVFTGWNIQGGEYEITAGSTSEESITIKPIDNLTVTPSFAEGQFLTVYTYSEDGYDKLTLKESNGTTTKTPINGVTQQADAEDFYGTTWDKSTQVDLTPGYSSSVTAQLAGSGSGKLYENGKYLITEGYRTIVFTNGWAWSQPRLYAWKGSSTAYVAWPGSNMEYACNNSSNQSVYVFQIPNEYTKIIFSGKNENEQQTSDITLPSGSNDVVAYYINGGTGNTPTVALWNPQPDTYTPNSDIIELKDVLYKDGSWAGNTEVWIYQNGSDEIVTTRRNLFDLIDGKEPLYNTDNADGTYTADSWTNFVNAYDDAVAAAGNKTAQQSAIDTAETALQDAFDALELQAYYTVNVTQTGATGTVAVGGETIDTATGIAQIAQNKTVTVTVTAPTGYHIASITGAISATNEATPYTANLTVDGNKEINITYAANPTVTVIANEGTVTVNGSTSPVVVDYKGDATIYVVADNGKYVSDITVNGTSVFEGNERSTTAEYTLTNVTVAQAVIVTYGTRTAYTITVDPYDEQGGKLYYDSEYTQEVPAEGERVTVYTGDNFTVYAKPNDSFAVECWVVDSNSAPAVNTYQFTNISANHTISVKWVELEEVSVSIKANPNSVATVTATSGNNTATNTGTNSFTILEGEQVTLTAGTISDTRFKFNGWVIKGDYTVVSGGTGAEEFVIKANENLEITANYTQVYRRIYLENAAGWSKPYIYVWGGSGFTAWPGDEMKDDPSSDYWYFDVPMDITNIQFNDGTNQNQKEFSDVSKNLYNNSTMTSGSYVEPGYYLQGTWNGYNYSAYDQVKFALDTDGNYLATITVTSTVDGYIYVNPTNEDSHYWNAATANATDNPQTLTATGAYQTSPNKVKVEIDTANTDKAYDVTFTFNPTTGNFAWTVAENIPTITIIGTDGRTTDDGQNKADQNIVTDNDRIGDTYFDLNTVLSAEAYKEISEKATAHAGEPVNFYTQVKPTTDGRYIYYVAGWVVNGTEFVHATNLGNGKYLGSYTFTQQENTFVPVYFHTQDWLTANGIETVTVYAVTDNTIENWDTYISAYTWYKVGGVKQYEQFGRYSGQVMIPVTGLDNVYYTIVEYGTKENIRISGITFNNYPSANDNGLINDTVITDYTNIQTYDYYEFIALLGDGKENITFVLKNTNDTQNDDKVGESNISIDNNWDFVQYTDYSGLRTDIFGNNIEEKEKNNELSDTNALYIVQAGDRYVTNHPVLDGQWYVECYLYDSTGKYLGKCYSYELHDEDAGIWDILGDYENQRAYISYEVGRPYDAATRYDGEWYGDADVSVTINLAVNVGLMGNDGYTVDTTDPVNDADYGYASINTTEQNINVERGKTVTISAKPKTGYKFVGWYSADGTLFSTNISLTVTAAVGTTYTAVFEELDQGKFYVNHYIYDGICETEGYVPIPNGGNAVLYVGIENATQQTNTTLLKGNSASIDVTEGDVLYITIATDATGADTFYSWYTDAFDKEGKTAYEEVGVDSDDNLYDNKGTVIGRNDMVYFKFKYEFKAGDAKSINLYSDLISVSINRVLLYSYTDRYGQAKTVKVPIVLTDEEVEGFAGNNFKPYTPAYITGDGWVNTVQANAPFVDGYYDDIVWVIDDNMFDKETFLLWASQSKKEYTVTIYSEADPDIRTCLYNDIITLDATELFGGKSGKGFWYEDVNGDGLYDENIDKIITYNAFYGYRVTSDICLGYEVIEDEMKFDVTLDAPVYSREQETDKAGNLVDKVYVDYMINIITPHLYGQEGWTEAPIYKGETITDNWNGAHVTIESYENVTGATLEYGVIVQQFGASITIGEDKTFTEAEAEAIDRGYMTGDADDTYLIETLQSEAGQIVVDGKVAYKKYEANNHPTNFNRVLFTVYYSNTTANQGKFFNAYGYIKITHADNSVEYHFSNAQYHNIYNTGTSTVPTDA